MNTAEDFENAPVGATATHTDGGRVMKMARAERSWVTPTGVYYGDNELAYWGFTLDPSAPTTAREALDLAWGLAHPVKEGQVIPVGAWLVDRRYNKTLVEKNTFFDIDVDEWGAENIRTLEPLPDPEPDWLDAPAVLATCGYCETKALHGPFEGRSRWECAKCQITTTWRALTDVTPLYPRGTEA